MYLFKRVLLIGAILLGPFLILEKSISVEASGFKTENTYSHSEINPVKAKFSKMYLIDSFKNLTNYSVYPSVSYNYDERWKLYSTWGFFTQKDRVVNITSIADSLLGKYRKQVYRTYKFHD